MFRRWLAIAIVALLAPSVLLGCGCFMSMGRQFIGGARMVAIATDVSPTELRIDAVLHGTASVSTITSSASAGCLLRERGQTFLVAEHCSDGDCYFFLRPIEDTAGELAFLHDRHFVHRADVIAAVVAWESGATRTAQFVRWISTADTEETDRMKSLTLPLIDVLQEFAVDSEAGERKAPELAASARRPLASFIKRLQLLPAAETAADDERVHGADPDATPRDNYLEILHAASNDLFDGDYPALFEKLYPNP